MMMMQIWGFDNIHFHPSEREVSCGCSAACHRLLCLSFVSSSYVSVLVAVPVAVAVAVAAAKLSCSIYPTLVGWVRFLFRFRCSLPSLPFLSCCSCQFWNEEEEDEDDDGACVTGDDENENDDYDKKKTKHDLVTALVAYSIPGERGSSRNLGGNPFHKTFPWFKGNIQADSVPPTVFPENSLSIVHFLRFWFHLESDRDRKTYKNPF